MDLFRLSIIGLLFATTSSLALAEVSTDGTIGRKTTTSAKHARIAQVLGKKAGRNLFHSFEKFGVLKDGSVTFEGDASLKNIISRVTGGQRSEIYGKLASEAPNADLWLINPKGVVFGKGASLDVKGGFHVGTADHVEFPDGGRFSARTPDGTTFQADPVKFGFLGEKLGELRIEKTKLAVRPQKKIVDH
jgi:filamentous hemagglutinin family protein